MQAFLINPLNFPKAITPIELDDVPSSPARLAQVRGHLGLGEYSGRAKLDIIGVGPKSWEALLLIADGRYHRDHVKELGEFRIMKRDGDYRSLPGRGIILNYDGSEAQLYGILASAGKWVSA